MFRVKHANLADGS